MSEQVESVGTAFPKQQERCRELLQEYIKIGPPGMFGAAMLRSALVRGEQAIASGDPIEILRSYEELKGFKS